MMSRRDFVGLAAAAAMGWPRAAQAQQRDGMRRLGALMVDTNGALGQTRAAALVQGLGAHNWHEGGNLRIDWRWGGGDPALFTRYATELVALGPEILVAHGSPSVAALRIASPENVPERLTRCLTTPAPIASAFVGSRSNFPLPLSHACLLWWNLWSCGRRACVVQAQRQIHRVLLVRCAAACKASVDHRGPEYHSVCDFASPLLYTTLKCS
jgi:hypothetical protein